MGIEKLHSKLKSLTQGILISLDVRQAPLIRMPPSWPRITLLSSLDSTLSSVGQGLLADCRKERNQQYPGEPFIVPEQDRWCPLGSTTQGQWQHSQLPARVHPCVVGHAQIILEIARAAQLRPRCKGHLPLSLSWPFSGNPTVQHWCFYLNRPHVKGKKTNPPT